MSVPGSTTRDAATRAEELLRANISERVRTGVPIAPLTTFRVGGPAAVYVEPETESDLAAIADVLRETGAACVVLGKGSNVLVSDRGYEGVVIRLGKGFRWTRADGNLLEAGASTPLPAVSNAAAAAGLGGLEFGVAIPGSLGGAVRMNAGAHRRSVSDVLRSADLYLLGAGERTTLTDLGFRYRDSDVAPDAVVVSAALELAPRSREEIRAEMDEAREWRRRTQPLAEPNCGSVFVNPPGDHAATLIEAAGGKDLSVGGARVAEKHANFIVTSEGARAADVLELIGKVQDVVAARFDIRLETEVRLVGNFGPAAS
jgi:UDP-N-acetylmuramate dehydrogenase